MKAVKSGILQSLKIISLLKFYYILGKEKSG